MLSGFLTVIPPKFTRLRSSILCCATIVTSLAFFNCAFNVIQQLYISISTFQIQSICYAFGYIFFFWVCVCCLTLCAEAHTEGKALKHWDYLTWHAENRLFQLCDTKKTVCAYAFSGIKNIYACKIFIILSILKKGGGEGEVEGRKKFSLLITVIIHPIYSFFSSFCLYLCRYYIKNKCCNPGC